jgi:hypothetical protein
MSSLSRRMSLALLNENRASDPARGPADGPARLVIDEQSDEESER